MKERLTPFDFQSDIEIFGEWKIDQNKVKINFLLTGEINEICWPLVKNEKRRDELWKESCFEFFVMEKNGPAYLEFNFWPTGEFNVYHFNEYRKLSGEYKGFEKFDYKFSKNEKSLSFHLVFDSVWKEKRDLFVSMTMVLKRVSGRVEYYAWRHSESRPDFHSAKSLIPYRD